MRHLLVPLVAATLLVVAGPVAAQAPEVQIVGPDEHCDSNHVHVPGFADPFETDGTGLPVGTLGDYDPLVFIIFWDGGTQSDVITDLPACAEPAGEAGPPGTAEGAALDNQSGLTNPSQTTPPAAAPGPGSLLPFYQAAFAVAPPADEADRVRRAAALKVADEADQTARRIQETKDEIERKKQERDAAETARLQAEAEADEQDRKGREAVQPGSALSEVARQAAIEADRARAAADRAKAEAERAARAAESVPPGDSDGYVKATEAAKAAAAEAEEAQKAADAAHAKAEQARKDVADHQAAHREEAEDAAAAAGKAAIDERAARDRAEAARQERDRLDREISDLEAEQIRLEKEAREKAEEASRLAAEAEAARQAAEERRTAEEKARQEQARRDLEQARVEAEKAEKVAAIQRQIDEIDAALAGVGAMTQELNRTRKAILEVIQSSAYQFTGLMLEQRGADVARESVGRDIAPVMGQALTALGGMITSLVAGINAIHGISGLISAGGLTMAIGVPVSAIDSIVGGVPGIMSNTLGVFKTIQEDRKITAAQVLQLIDLYEEAGSKLQELQKLRDQLQAEKSRLEQAQKGVR